ncbi:Calx-beta domain-containing protein, partial [Arenibacter palladensis]
MNTLSNILSNFLVSYKLKFLVFVITLLFFGFNGYGQTVAFNATASNGLESVSSAALAVSLSAASGSDVSVDYTVTGTATGGGTDYTLSDGTLTILAGSVTGNINITGIVDDLLDEPNETVVVTLSSPTNAT